MPDASHLSQTALTTAWTAFKSRGDREARNDLVLHYQSLVRYVASKVATGLPSMVARDDLVSYGTFGLIDAIDKYDLSKGVKFETYAVARIKGSIIDELRALDWVPRTVRSKARDVEKAEAELAMKYGRPAEDSELAEHLGVSLTEVWAVQSQASSSYIGSIDEGWATQDGDRQFERRHDTMFDSAADPAEQYSVTEIMLLLAEVISTMPQRAKTILVLYYLQEMTLAEIGEVLGVTESRVCQLQSRVLQTLGESLGRGVQIAA